MEESKEVYEAPAVEESTSPTEQKRRLLRELELLREARKVRRKNSGIDYYTPNPMQMKAHQSKARIVVFSGGNRSGKSTLGAVTLVWHLTKKYPDYFPKEFRYQGPIKAVVVCDANQKIEKVIEPKIREYLPKDFIRSKRVLGGYLNRLNCIDGSTIDFLSAEQDDMAFEGADWDFYWGDEPQKKRKFDAIMRGLIDRGGRAILTFTPLIEPWMKEQLVDAADGKRIEAFVVDTYDNLFDINGKPILTKENVEEMARWWDEETKESRLHGKFFHLRGIVYKEFSDMHLQEFAYEYPDPVYVVLDPHDRQPHHVIWAFVDRKNHLYVHSELDSACTVKELAGKIKRIEADNGYRVVRRIIDPNFGRRPLVTTGKTFIQELASHNCGGWTEVNDSKEEGHMKVRDYLHYDQKLAISHTNTPRIFFSKSRVPRTIHSVRNYQYDEWAGKVASEKDPKEKPKERETHGADTVRYLCMSEPYWEPNNSKLYELAENPY